jgi:hypothetical protein
VVLSAPSLSQFPEYVTQAEALIAEIAVILKGLQAIGPSRARAEVSPARASRWWWIPCYSLPTAIPQIAAVVVTNAVAEQETLMHVLDHLSRAEREKEFCVGRPSGDVGLGELGCHQVQ